MVPASVGELRIESGAVRTALTLIELLVVISIIALLIAILLPTIKKARFWAQVTACGSNVHQLTVGSLAFANDYDGMLPRHPNLPFSIQASTLWDNNTSAIERGRADVEALLLAEVDDQGP